MNKYLSNITENLEVLDLIEKKDLSKNARLKLRGKAVAICHLKALQNKMPSSNFYTEPEELQIVSTKLLSDEKAVKTLNCLAENGYWNNDAIILYGNYLKMDWNYLPKVLADCISGVLKRGIHTKTFSVCSLRLLYELRITGHERLRDMLLKSPGVLKDVTENSIKLYISPTKDQLDEMYLSTIQKFKILEELPEDFNPDDESGRILDFPDILAQPGALDLYQASAGYCSYIRLETGRDYSEVTDIVKETLGRIRGLYADSKDTDLLSVRYMEKASDMKFDRKLLKGFLGKMKDMDAETVENAVASKSGFLAVCTGGRYIQLVNRIAENSEYNRSNFLMELVFSAIRDHKKAFLRLMEEKLELFLELPSNSLLHMETFQNRCNLNTLQEKDIRTLLKKDENGKFIYSGTTCRSLECLSENKIYTFQELILLALQPNWISRIYSMLDRELRIDEKMRRIRQLLHGDVTPESYSEEYLEATAKALSQESLEDYGNRRKITGISRKERFQMMVLEKMDTRVSVLVDEAVDSLDAEIILHNQKRPELYELGLHGFKESFTDLDADSKWLAEQMEVPAEHAESFKQFCLNGNATITHDYYKGLSSSQNQQKENIILLAKASIYAMLDTVKYQNFQSEIGYPVSDSMEQAWKENLSMAEDRFTVAEYSDFRSCMTIGANPARTCMHYVDGMYNECLLATFDANKKVLYVSENGQVIGRALLRLTKASDAANAKAASLLHFADVGEKETNIEEHPVLFLERCYKNGYTGGKANLIYQRLFELAKKKAAIMGMPLVLADDYSWVAGQNHYVRTQSNIYVSRSKNGKQYLDSLGGNCDKGGYYVSGSFYFAS